MMPIPNIAGDAITKKSIAIIVSRLGNFLPPDDVLQLVIRIAHTTGDVEFAKTILFSEGAVRAGVDAICAGAPVITDAGMVAAGIRAQKLKLSGSRIICRIEDPEIAAMAHEQGITKSAAAMRYASPYIDGAIIAIGNAPTALFELITLIQAGAKPALIIGVPVGFVGAKESKQALWELQNPVPRITNIAERGGSPIAATIVNGLIAQAQDNFW